MDNLSDLEIGKAGEHLVCFDLITKGYKAYLSDQGLPYDVVLDKDSKLYRIQVKSSRIQRKVPQRVGDIKGFLYHLKRCGKGGTKLYSLEDFDFMALVSIETKEIAYIKLTDISRTMILKSNFKVYMNTLGKYFEDFPLEKVLNEFN